jgi:hypothetical protein
VEGELALHHGEGPRAANPNANAYDPYAYAYDPNANAYDPNANAYSDAYDPYAHSDSHAYAPGCCPVRSGAVVLQHPGAELLCE